MIIAANPSTLVNLARAGDQEKETLIRDIHDGTLSHALRHPGRRARRPRAADCASASASVRTRAGRDRPPHRHALSARTTGRRDCIIGNWTGGSVGAYLRHFPHYYGDTPVRDVGLIASEGRMTIPIADGTPSGVLDITTHYFEFIPEEEVDSPQPTVLAAHELQRAASYYILLTTAYGLYRYNIHDVVRVTGFLQRTPLIEFLSKGADFANITGEKLSEYQVTAGDGRRAPRAEPDADRLQRGPVLGRRAAVLRPVRGTRRLRRPRRRACGLAERSTAAARAEHRVRGQARQPAAGAVRLELVPPAPGGAGTGDVCDNSAAPGTVRTPCLVPQAAVSGLSTGRSS